MTWNHSKFKHQGVTKLNEIETTVNLNCKYCEQNIDECEHHTQPHCIENRCSKQDGNKLYRVKHD